MFTIDTVWAWLIRSAVLNTLALAIGALVISRVRQPAERIRVVNWVLAICLIAPWLPVQESWQTVSLNLTTWSEPAADSPSDETRPPIEPEAAPAAVPPQDPAPQRAAGTSVTMGDAAVHPNIDDSQPVAGAPSAPAQPVSASPSMQQLTASTPAASHFTARVLSLRNLLIASWTLAFGMITARLLTGVLLRGRLERQARPASPAVHDVFRTIAGTDGNRVRLIATTAIDGPVTWGILRPVIAIPDRMQSEATEAELRWSLAHEWSHVHRRDIVSLWLATAAQLICFYQPLYWLLRRRLLLCQDYIADAFAAHVAGSEEDYAEFLLKLAASRQSPAARPALGIVGCGSQLSQRIRMLVAPGTNVASQCRRHFNTLTACGSAACLLLLTTIQLDANAHLTSSTAASSGHIDIHNTAPGVLAGVLINASTGQPVPNAKVILRGDFVQRTTANSHGQFRFKDVTTCETGLELFAWHNNMTTDRISVAPLPNEDVTAVRFPTLRPTMGTGRQVRFAITSGATGHPVPQALVRFGYPDSRKLMSQSDGTITASGLLPQEYTVTVEAAGFAGRNLRINLNNPRALTNVDVRLEQGGNMQGKVIDEHGQPVSGARITLQKGRHISHRGRQVHTGMWGRFRDDFLPLNVPIEVTVAKQNYRTVTQEFTLSSDHPSHDLEIQLLPQPAGDSVSGQVLDQHGQPVANVLVASYGSQPSQQQLARTDVAGRFVIHDLFEGPAGPEIHVSGEGLAPQRLPVQPGTAEAPAFITVNMEPGLSVRGQVRTDQGDAVDGAVVMARSSAFRWGLAGFEATRADESGQFAFTSLPPDAQFQVSHPDFNTSSTRRLPLNSDQLHTITLPTPGQLQGQVIDEQTQQPVPQFRICLNLASGSDQPAMNSVTWNPHWSAPGLLFSSDDGRFQFRPLPARVPIQLTIHADGYESLVVPQVVTRRNRDSHSRIYTLRPRRPEDSGSLTVRLIDHQGRPATNTQLRLIVSEEQSTGLSDNRFNWSLIESGQLERLAYVSQFLSGVTDASGEFQFTDILPNRYLQLVSWGQHVPRSRSLEFDRTRPAMSETVLVDVPQPASVRGTIDRSQFPRVGTVHISDRSNNLLSYDIPLADDQSEFELNNLSSGQVVIGIASPRTRVIENGVEMYRATWLARQTVDLTPGTVTEITFDQPR